MSSRSLNIPPVLDLTVRRGHVLVVGVGDDGPIGLSPRVWAAVRKADVLVGGRRHLELFDEVAAEKWVVGSDVKALIRRIGTEGARQRTVVLASGDPCFFGIGPLLADALGRARVTIVPGVSAVALAFARLGIAWQDATVVSAHGRPLAEAIQAARGAHKLAVLTDAANTPNVVARALLTAGADNADAWIFEHLGGLREGEVQATLRGLADPAWDRQLAALNTVVVPTLTWAGSSALDSGVAPAPRVQASARPRFFGLPESEYAHKDSLITKPEVRAISLSKLRLRSGQVLWDIGAGSGSLAIEAAGLVAGLTVYAVERSAAQVQLLGLNVETHGVADVVRVIRGEAPAALHDLPDPHAVFVGGSGGQLATILDASSARLAPGGRIVVNLVTLEGVATALQWAREHAVAAETVQVSIARGSEIVGMTRLQAENPVTMVTLRP